MLSLVREKIMLVEGPLEPVAAIVQDLDNTVIYDPYHHSSRSSSSSHSHGVSSSSTNSGSSGMKESHVQESCPELLEVR